MCYRLQQPVIIVKESLVFQCPVKSITQQQLQKGLGLCPDTFAAFNMIPTYVTKLEVKMKTAVLALMQFWYSLFCLTILQIQILLNLLTFSLLIKGFSQEILSFVSLK